MNIVISESIRKLRTEKGISQEILAERMGVSVTAGDDVHCGDIGSNVSAGGDIECSVICGNVQSCKGDIECTEIQGDARCEGDITIHKNKTERKTFFDNGFFDKK